MNEDVLKGKWKQIKGTLREKWGQLTDDDLDIAEGNSEYLAGKIQERYGRNKDEARKEVDDFTRTL